MRVLHVYKTYYPDSVGGIEQVIRQLARGLQVLGVESRVLTMSPSADPAWIDRPEARVQRFKSSLDLASTPMSWSAWKGMSQALEWADVVHYQFPWPFADVLDWRRENRRPAVVTYQSDVVRQRLLNHVYRPLMTGFLRRADAVVATSPQYLASSPVLRDLGRPVDIVPNGVDEATLPACSPQELERWRGELGEGFMLFVGVLRYYKGVDQLIRASLACDAPIVIAGSGPGESTLRALAAELGAHRVRFLGEVSEGCKAALLQLARAFVFPSNLRSEAFGMSLVEAAIFGKPLVTCEIGTGTSFVNLHEQTGFVVPPNDPASLSRAMTQLWESSELAQRMGRGARERYEELMTAERMARNYLAIYERCLHPSPLGNS